MSPFKRKRLAAGLTQQQIADKLKISQAAVKKWDQGEAKPSPRFFPKLAKILGITADEAVSLFDPSPSVA